MQHKKFSKSLAALGLAVLCSVNVFAAALTDVSSTHWAYESIVSLEKQGFVTYNSKGEYSPNLEMTYFDIVSVLAKATGYVDVDTATNVTDAEKQAIKTNYENQKPTLDTYSAKYSTWVSLYNQEIAYLLGRGYIKTTDLDKFVTVVNGKETKGVITKQELAAIVVRILGKEVTAINAYTSTGFKDEAKIDAAYRPHLAYLKTLGLVNPDANGNCNPQMNVTKALCAKMVNDALVTKAKQDAAGTGSTAGTEQTVLVRSVVPKNTPSDEYYLLLRNNGNDSYYSIKNTVVPTDATGKAMSIEDLKDKTVAVTITLQGSSEYITSIRVVESNTTTTTSSTVTGTLLEKSSSGVLRLALTDGTSKSYLLSDTCIITLNGTSTTSSNLSVGDQIIATIQNSTITAIQATKGTSTNVSANLTTGEVTARTLVSGGYQFTITNGTQEETIFVADSATVQRNGKTRALEALRVGDTLTLTRGTSGITRVVAIGVQSTITGSVKEIHIAQPARVVVNTTNGPVTYVIGEETELYDTTTRKYITIRDLHLGQQVELLLESKEVVSLDITSKVSSINYKGVIEEVGKGSEYIGVILDYDPISGATGVYKRINVPATLNILNSNNKQVSRATLKEGMEVIINYQYLDDVAPQKILIMQ